MEVALLFGVIWAAVLVPQWLENRRDSRPTASITSFNRKLWSLQRSTPTYDDVEYSSNYGVAPRAPGRRTRPDAQGWPDDSIAADEIVDYSAEDLSGDLIRELDVIHPGWADDNVDDDHDETWSPDEWSDASDEPSGNLAATGGVTPLGVAPVRALHSTTDDAPHAADEQVEPGEPGDPAAGVAVWSSSAARRAAAMRRRRQVFLTLLSAAIATAFPAAWLGSAWWVVHAVADILLFTYVCLLVRRQRRLAERTEKVHVLSPAQASRPLVVVLGPANSTGTDQ